MIYIFVVILYSYIVSVYCKPLRSSEIDRFEPLNIPDELLNFDKVDLSLELNKLLLMNLKERNETKIEASINSLKATNSVVTTIYSLVSISIFTILSFVIRCLKRHQSAIVILESSFKLIQTIVLVFVNEE